VKVTDLTIVSEKYGNDLESMKAYNIKITDDINTLKKDTDKQFVKVTEEIADVRGIMANTKSDMYKFVDDKFSFEEDDTTENTWVKVAGKHFDAKLGRRTTPTISRITPLCSTGDASTRDTEA